ncbi:TRAP transporter small permease subunit [Donghicola sp.]|jgi:TRAP-type mannitol/chloroaromatic compound transport system permease small subunit|uniref:TRAP transporter small permease subunit n=1 Tax=Donghicola sp. TaxID=1929294 RepID=UPI0025D39435|nr:TRAP transporter small permease subunit [Donghicola sp.]MCT4578659.1 TRAP transporter small permease subunit [Donghicola sp.]
MERLLAVSDGLAAPCRAVARVCGWLLLVLMAVILYDVIGRRFFSTGSFKLQELEWHIHGAIAVLCFGFAYVENAHVRIDLFSQRMTRKTRLWIDILAIALFLIPFMVLLVWYGYDFTMRSFTRGEGSPGGVGLPNRWIIKSAIPIGALLTISGGLSVLLRAIVALRRPDLVQELV